MIASVIIATTNAASSNYQSLPPAVPTALAFAFNGSAPPPPPPPMPAFFKPGIKVNVMDTIKQNRKNAPATDGTMKATGRKTFDIQKVSKNR